MIARKQIHGTLSFYATKVAGMRVSEGNPNRRSFRVTQCNEASLEPKVQGLRFAPVGARYNYSEKVILRNIPYI